MKLKYLNTVLRYYRFLSTYLLTTGEGQPPFDIMVVPLVIHNICLGENGTQIHGTNILSLFLVSFAAANLPHPGNHSEAIRDVNPIDSPTVCQIIFVPFIYCHYTHSASYDPVQQPSCDNEECRF